MRRPSTRPASRSSNTLAWVRSKTDGILLAHAGQAVDVEEAPVPAGAPGRSRRPRPASVSSAHQGLASSAAMWFGTMSRTIPMPGLVGGRGQPPEALLAAEVAADASSGPRRRSRGWSPAGPAGTATGRGGRCRGPAGRGRCEPRRRSRSPGSAAAGRWRGTAAPGERSRFGRIRRQQSLRGGSACPGSRPGPGSSSRCLRRRAWPAPG